MQNSLHLISEKRKSEPKEASKEREINIKLAKMLIAANCSLDHKDFQLHETAIFKAIVVNDYELVKLFVVEGMNVAIRNIFGNDALSRSIQLARYSIARLLIDVDSPIRKSTCFYKMPKAVSDERNLNVPQYDNERVFQLNAAPAENSLIDSLSKYEDFLKYLRIHTQEKPRSLKDVARLAVRKSLRRPISAHMTALALPQCINDLLLLKDIEHV
jgi:ankyrin repeat protein